VIALPTRSTVRAPIALASGPASANPNGSSASEPTQSYELTRESACGGMYRASDVSHQMPNSANPNPIASATAITTASGACSAKAVAIAGHGSTSSSPTYIGRRGRQRIATSAPSTAPPPATLSSTPKMPALPYRLRETIGASAYHCVYRTSTMPVNAAIVTHTHGRETVSRQPVRSSEIMDGEAGAGSWPPRTRPRTRTSSAALITKVSASNRKASPAPTPSTSAVDSAGPISTARL